MAERWQFIGIHTTNVGWTNVFFSLRTNRLQFVFFIVWQTCIALWNVTNVLQIALIITLKKKNHVIYVVNKSCGRSSWIRDVREIQISTIFSFFHSTAHRNLLPLSQKPHSKISVLSVVLPQFVTSIRTVISCALLYFYNDSQVRLLHVFSHLDFNRYCCAFIHFPRFLFALHSIILWICTKFTKKNK